MNNNSKQLLADKLFRFSIVFLVVYLGLTLLFPPQKQDVKKNPLPATFSSVDSTYATGELVSFEVKNNQNKPITAVLKAEKRENGEWKTLPLKNNTVSIAPEEKTTLSFSEQNIELFTDTGKYRAVLTSANGDFLGEDEFEVKKGGFFHILWQILFFKPIYNLLVVCLEITDSHLFAAIILLTVIIKLILLVPSKKAILAQQKMQKIQPELERIKKKYKHDPQEQAQHMMALWKKHKVNPGAALVPTLIQFPVLIALFFVVKQGLMPHNAFLMYPLPFLEQFDFSAINFHFLWMSLDKPDPFFILPLSIGALQFWQMYTMQAKRKKQEGETKKKEKAPHEAAMGMMTYILPIIVVVFSATLPAAVGLYWGTSTVFAIVQQHILAKTKDTPPSKKQKKEGEKEEESKENTPKITRIRV